MRVVIEFVSKEDRGEVAVTVQSTSESVQTIPGQVLNPFGSGPCIENGVTGLIVVVLGVIISMNIVVSWMREVVLAAHRGRR